MGEEKMLSQELKEFLQFLRWCQSEYQTCVNEVWRYDKQQQDQLHDLEFANSYEERNKIATRVHKERVERRKYKDRKERVEKIAKFCSDSQNKKFIDRLKSLIDEQERVEKYLSGERHYNRRGGDVNADS